MTILLDKIPNQIRATVGQREVTVGLRWYQGFEVFAACELQAKVSLDDIPGYDIYDSSLYPGLTIQVKASHALSYKSRKGRLIFSFSSLTNKAADVYLLFGVKDGIAYPFVLSLAEWKDRSSIGGNRDILVFSASRFHFFCPGQTKPTPSKFWSDFYLERWPQDLHKWFVRHSTVI